MTDLISQIRAAMERQGIGVVELSRRANKQSHRHLSDILRGKFHPGEDTLQEIADALGEPLERPPIPARRFDPRSARS